MKKTIITHLAITFKLASLMLTVSSQIIGFEYVYSLLINRKDYAFFENHALRLFSVGEKAFRLIYHIILLVSFPR